MLENTGTQPINKSIHYTGCQSVDDHRTCDGEHLRAHAQDESLCFEFHSRGGDGVGKAGDGDQCARAGVFGNVIIDAQPGEQGGQGNQGHGGSSARVLLFQPQKGVDIHKYLPQNADQSADPEGVQAVFYKGRFWCHSGHQIAVLFLRHMHSSVANLPRKRENMRQIVPGRK